MNLVTFTAAASLLLTGAAFAQDNQQNSQQKIEVQPGNGPTESITKATPTIKDRCPDQAGTNVNPQAPGTEATEATGAAVPNMKPDSAIDCPDGQPKGGGG